jgi:hypothetical protein
VLSAKEDAANTGIFFFILHSLLFLLSPIGDVHNCILYLYISTSLQVPKKSNFFNRLRSSFFTSAETYTCSNIIKEDHRLCLNNGFPDDLDIKKYEEAHHKTLHAPAHTVLPTELQGMPFVYDNSPSFMSAFVDRKEANKKSEKINTSEEASLVNNMENEYPRVAGLHETIAAASNSETGVKI